jgi:hypothetical protein
MEGQKMNIFKIPAEQNLKDQWDLTTTRITEWLQSELFHFKWWVLLVLFCITALLMWKKANKSRIVELTIYSAFIIIFVIVLDELGEELSLWFYTVDILPLFPPISAIDITSMPLIYMLIYQRFGTWGKFLIATLIMATIFCFVFEPIFVWGGIYTMLIWKSFYGLPIYFGIAAASKGLVNAIYSTKEKRKT